MAFHNHQEEIDAAVAAHPSFQTRQKTAEYARKVAGQMFGKRVSTIFDPRYGTQPWCAYWDDARDETPEFMGRGKTAAEAIRKLIVITKAARDGE